MTDSTHESAEKAFRRFQEAMRKLVRVPKKELDEKLAAERRTKRTRRKPA